MDTFKFRGRPDIGKGAARPDQEPSDSPRKAPAESRSRAHPGVLPKATSVLIHSNVAAEPINANAKNTRIACPMDCILHGHPARVGSIRHDFLEVNVIFP